VLGLDACEWLGKYISPVVVGVHFYDLDCSIKDLVTKMMEFNG